MNNINWYYPNSPAEASTLMLRGKTILHAGSTGLRGRDIPSGTSLLDLSKAGLSNCTIKPAAITLGAMCTYADVVKALQEKIPDHILVKSLKPAANTPLRNRITVGGSVAFFPPWSDLMGPLLALDATVVLAGKNEGEYPIAAFIEKKELREQSLITSIKIPAGEWLAAHHREIRSVSDMPAFTITLLLQKELLMMVIILLILQQIVMFLGFILILLMKLCFKKDILKALLLKEG